MRVLEILRALHFPETCLESDVTKVKSAFSHGVDAFRGLCPEVDPQLLNINSFYAMCSSVSRSEAPAAAYFLPVDSHYYPDWIDLDSLRDLALSRSAVGVFFLAGLIYEDQGDLPVAASLYGWSILADEMHGFFDVSARTHITNRYLFTSEVANDHAQERVHYSRLYTDIDFIRETDDLYRELQLCETPADLEKTKERILFIEPLRIFLGERFRFSNELKLLNELERAHHVACCAGDVRPPQEPALLVFFNLYREKCGTTPEREDRDILAAFNRIKVERDLVYSQVLSDDLVHAIHGSFEEFVAGLAGDDALLVEAELAVAVNPEYALKLYQGLFQRYPESTYLRHQCAVIDMKIKKAPAKPAP